jgi:hypothetical protein
VITGLVTVTKNPYLHPGDIRIFTAVAPPDVSVFPHLHDVLVFPTDDDIDRPHPDGPLRH